MGSFAEDLREFVGSNGGKLPRYLLSFNALDHNKQTANRDLSLHHWLLNDSPYAAAHVVKDPLDVITKGAVLDLQAVSVPRMMAANISLRELIGSKPEVSYMVAAIDNVLGVDYPMEIKYILAHNVRLYRDDDDSSFILWGSGYSNSPCSWNEMSVEGVKNFLNHTPHGNSKTIEVLSRSGGYPRFSTAWQPRSIDSGARFCILPDRKYLSKKSKNTVLSYNFEIIGKAGMKNWADKFLAVRDSE
jgi:hypothetical protein